MIAGERLYEAYRRERSNGLGHAQIAADGVYGAEVEAFGLRYSSEQSAYFDAMKRRERDPAHERIGEHPGYSVDGRSLKGAP